MKDENPAPVTMRTLSDLQLDQIARTAYSNVRKGRARFSVYDVLSMCAEIQTARRKALESKKRILVP